MGAKVKSTPKTTEEFLDYRIGEVETKLDELGKDTKSGLEGIQKKLDDNFATKDYVDERDSKLDERIKNVEEKITEYQDDKKWLVRLVFGAIIMAVLGLVLYAGGK